MFSDRTYLPGEPVDVAINIQGNDSPVRVEEITPDGWTVKDLLPGGMYINGKNYLGAGTSL